MSEGDAKLMAFVDGELDAAERAEIEAALERDADLRARLEAQRLLRSRVSEAFDGTLSEPVPARLLEAAASNPAAQVIDFAEQRARRWGVREWGAMAASVLVGVFAGVGVMNARAPEIVVTESGVQARGVLARALETQLASDEDSAVRIGLTFNAEDGRFCRTFDLTQSDTAGLACREEGAWRVTMTATGEGGGEVRMASTPREILLAVDDMIAGEPFDAEAEARARDASWRR